MKRRILPIALALASMAGCATVSSTPPARPDGEGLVFLVRHAETSGPGRDPALSAAGEQRAQALANLLAGEGIERILTSPYHRTRDTAKPLASRLGITVEEYDPSDLQAVAESLRNSGDVILIVGHSNTTGEMAGFLGGDPGSKIGEHEHERVYRVEIPSGRSTMTRY
ncbi:MAG TPA: phosphoglycerate mutase family protein [Thermoanaerobaculia bacterium]|nr:phosphoglycerate mutase family protein [Thermoanaerobaculia bacterium]